MKNSFLNPELQKALIGKNLTQGTFNENFQHIWQYFNERNIAPRIILAGKTGVGKSSIINALLGEEVCEIGVIPTTKEEQQISWSTPKGELLIVDFPGFGEAEKATETYDQNIRDLGASEGHLLLLVLKADDRALEEENLFLEKWQKANIDKIPTLIVVNQIDKMKPARDWQPKVLNLEVPATEKEQNIITYLNYVSGLDNFKGIPMISFSAGEFAEDKENQYGIAQLVDAIFEALPESARTDFARLAKEKTIRDKQAVAIIKKYSATAFGIVLANPLPIADALPLSALQVLMIIHLGRLYNIQITKGVAAGLASAIGTSLAGRAAFQLVISAIPGLKNLAGPPLAASLTYTIGRTIQKLFSLGQMTATREEITGLVKQYAEEAKNFAKKLEKDLKEPNNQSNEEQKKEAE